MLRLRIAKVENYKNNHQIENWKIDEIPPIERNVAILSDRDKVKVIKTIERIVRSSMENKDYITFLKKEIDMTQCSFFNNVKQTDKGRVRIEIHHEPFTLFDITQIVLEKHIKLGEKINYFKIAEEVMKLHYRGRVGLIPLSITIHKLTHIGKIFIPLQAVYGDFLKFLEEYDEYISEDLKSLLEYKLTMSKDPSNLDMSILEKKFIYLEVDGVEFPQLLQEK